MNEKVVIVYTKGTEKYANYLMQLISISSYEKDGQITAACWSLDELKDSMAKMSSAHRIIFLGSDKKVDTYTSEIEDTFSKYGMHYGWLGRQAVLRVEKDALSITRKYKEFCQFAQEHQRKLKAVLDAKLAVTTGVAVAAAGSTATAAAAITSLLGSALLLPIISIWTMIPIGAKLLKESSKVIDQKYRCLVAVFYQEGLRKYLEGVE